MGRPHVPWAYGAHPAQLAKNCGESLVAIGLLGPRDLLDFTRRRVRGAEALTMFCSTVRYLMLPAVDSLSLGRLDEPERWKMNWGDPLAQDMRTWLKTGLEEREIFRLHDQHRADMVRLRRLLRSLTPIDQEHHHALVRIRLVHADPSNGLIAIARVHRFEATLPVLVVFHFGLADFSATFPYHLPLSGELCGDWRVLFDGDRYKSCFLRDGEKSVGYPDGYVIAASREDNTLALSIGANSLLVLQHT